MKADNLKIAYIGGGSRGWAWGFMMDLAMDADMCGVVRLYDIDQEAARANCDIGNLAAHAPEGVSKWRYEVAEDLKTALTGVDFVVISILPGTFKEMESDVHAPEKYGVYQSVGDTTGPGGLMRALRTIPMFRVIAEAIRDYAPGAWVINYTNPMTMCLRTLYEVYPGIKAFGCCHEVFGTQKLLASMLEDMEGIEGVNREDIKVGVTGINHFTWLYSASYQERDLFPLYLSFAQKYYETGFVNGKDDNWMNNHFESAQRVKFDLFLRYGWIAAAGDRHLAEFMPQWYLKSPEHAREWLFSLTPVSWRWEDLKNRLDRSKRLLAGEEQFTWAGSGEEGHLLMKALLGLGDRVSNVNVPNQGQIMALPMGAVVETNALFRRDEIAPVVAKPLPQGIDAWVARHALNQEAIVKAALTDDKALAFRCFVNDPMLVNVSCADAGKLFEEMLAAQRGYLSPAWFK